MQGNVLGSGTLNAEYVKKQIIKPLIPSVVLNTVKRWSGTKPIAEYTCNICGFHGWFRGWYRPYIIDSRCPKCDSIERTRLLALAMDEGLIPVNPPEENVLHFAPEKSLEPLFRKLFPNYQTADLFHNADLTLNLEALDVEPDTYSLIIANHVLEHVDDLQASREIHRVLAPGGLFVCMVPIIEGWDSTYENAKLTSSRERKLHYGQEDHLRYYGKDFRTRIATSGLIPANEITAEGENVARYKLNPGEKVFVFQK